MLKEIGQTKDVHLYTVRFKLLTVPFHLVGGTFYSDLVLIYFPCV